MQSLEGTYTGEWDRDDKNGFGTMIYANKDCYEGQWKDGLREGEG